MKLSGSAAQRFLSRPDPARPGCLIWGADAMRVAMRRQDLISALIGPDGPAEMRLTAIAAGDLRRDPALLADAIKARGFFPGPRAVHLEDAGDGLAPVVASALSDWQPGDAALVVTAGSLGKASALRKVFEAHPEAAAIAVYDDPPDREEVQAMLSAAGLGRIAPEAMTDLMTLAAAVDPGDLRQTIAKLGLYKLGDAGPVTPEDVAVMAPATLEAEADDVIHAAAEGRVAEIGTLVQRLSGQGQAATGLAIAATRHFRALHAAAASPGGPAAGVARLRPPIFGPRRDRLIRQAQAWGVPRLEQALALLTDTDLMLRSSARVPGMAAMERALVRIAMLARAGRTGQG